ncbi:hypothetical protein ES703_95567 [subsurface metagenome]
MATIVFLEDVIPIVGCRRGVHFDCSQAGPFASKRSSPINHQTNDRMKLRTILKATNAYYWKLNNVQQLAWGVWAIANGITGPWGMAKHQAGCAGFFALQLNARLAGDPFYPNPPGNIPIPGVTFTNLQRIDKDTIRATFNPSPSGLVNRIYLRQALPGPGVRRWSKADGYIAERSAFNVVSPYDFTTHFQHLAAWNCRYWTGTQEDTGRRSTEDLWTL